MSKPSLESVQHSLSKLGAACEQPSHFSPRHAVADSSSLLLHGNADPAAENIAPSTPRDAKVGSSMSTCTESPVRSPPRKRLCGMSPPLSSAATGDQNTGPIPQAIYEDVMMPYTGDFSGATWNSQALFVRRSDRTQSEAQVCGQADSQSRFLRASGDTQC